MMLPPVDALRLLVSAAVFVALWLLGLSLLLDKGSRRAGVVLLATLCVAGVVLLAVGIQ